MLHKQFCVYNGTRESLLNPRVTLIDIVLPVLLVQAKRFWSRRGIRLWDAARSPEGESISQRGTNPFPT